MDSNPFFLIFRTIAAMVFVGNLCVAVYLYRNQARLFGADSKMPSDSLSSRAYTKLQAWVIWAHVQVASALFALMLH